MSEFSDMTVNSFDLSNYLPGQSIDCVIIGFDQHELKILVLKWKGLDLWTLPGGFIQLNESMDAAAVRILKNRTGLDFSFLEQFHTFGNADRRNKEEIFKDIRLPIANQVEFLNWIQQRFITTGYLALVDINKCHLKPDLLSDACEWRSLSSLPDLILDHIEIVSRALDHIKTQSNYLPIGISLLPEKFTMKAFKKLYEAILVKSLDRGNFQRKILKLGVLIRLEKQLTGGSHKAPYLYKFDTENYDKLLQKGIGFLR